MINHYIQTGDSVTGANACQVCGLLHWPHCGQQFWNPVQPIQPPYTTTWTSGGLTFDESERLERIEKMAMVASSNGGIYGNMRFFLEEGIHVFVRVDPLRDKNRWTVWIHDRRWDTDDPAGLLQRAYKAYCKYHWGFSESETECVS